MIAIEKRKIGDDVADVFTILNDGFNGVNGWVELECRIYDGDSEGIGLNMDVSDQDVAKNGQYSPLELSKDETQEFINFLQKSHDQMCDQEAK